jgi:DNA repair protein RadC
VRLAEPDSILRQWPQTERPTFRAIQRGPESLTDAELISVLLRTGRGGQSAIETARHMILEGGSLLAAVSNASALPGDQAARLAVSLELARRVLRERMSLGDILSSPAAVRDYLRLLLHNREHEVFVIVLLDAQNRVLESEELFRGTLTQTSVYPREVVKRALHHNAAAVIFAHNHPSGVAEPSHADEALTQALKQALALVDVRVLDHFIVAGSGVLSFAERGLL